MKPSRKRPRDKGRGAFTLIELLIVIAIIAILSAIALPNFLEAQIRAKLSRVRADFHSLAAGLEAYRADNLRYPWRHDPALPPKYNAVGYRLAGLTTPIGYLTSVNFADPFVKRGTDGAYNDGLMRWQYNYRNHEFFNMSFFPAGRPIWILNSLGPDRVKNQGLKVEVWARGLDPSPPSQQTLLYDPTNGITSAGDIPRTGGASAYQCR